MFRFLFIFKPEENIKHDNWKNKVLSITREAIKSLWLDVCSNRWIRWCASVDLLSVKFLYRLKYISHIPHPSGLGWRREKTDISVARVQLCPLYTSVFYSVTRKETSKTSLKSECLIAYAKFKSLSQEIPVFTGLYLFPIVPLTRT